MSIMQQELINDMRTVAPAQHYSKIVEFAKEVAEEASDDTPTSVEIFSDGGHWYCQGPSRR